MPNTSERASVERTHTVTTSGSPDTTRTSAPYEAASLSSEEFASAEAGGIRWLEHDEQLAWRSFLYGVQTMLDRMSEALIKAPGINLTFPEYEILVRLSESETGSLRMAELADLVVHSRSRLTHTISRLEARGIVERRRSECDGRGREATLTKLGYELLDRAAPVHVNSVRKELLDVVGHDDFIELGRILEKTLSDDISVVEHLRKAQKAALEDATTQGQDPTDESQD